MKKNNLNPRILSNKSFNKDTYTIVHTKSSLNLNDIEKEKIENNWKQFIQESETKQWNGTYYRMENIQDILPGLKQLSISTIKYSEVRSLKDDEELSKRYSANNIGTASLIKTIDNYFIFGIRNINSSSRSKKDLIGGGLQESELVVNTFSDVFRNEIKEIEEEIGLKEKDIKDIQGIGILQSGYSNVLFIFHTQLNIAKEEVQEIFNKNKDDEMVKLEYIKEEMLEEYLKDMSDYRPLITELSFLSFNKNIP